MSKFAVLLVLGVWLVGGCQIPPQNGESGPPAPQILPSGDVIGVEPAQTVVTDPAPAPPVTKPLWMMLPKSWHRDCKRWIKPIASATYKYGDPQDSPLMYAAQIRQESLCSPDAKSHVGAMGLGQIMPATAREIREKWGEGAFDVWDGAANIKASLWYDQRMRKFWRVEYRSWCNRVALMFASYNAGAGNLFKSQKVCQSRGFKSCNDYIPIAAHKKFVTGIHARENLNYVRIIMGTWHDMMPKQSCPPFDATPFLDMDYTE